MYLRKSTTNILSQTGNISTQNPRPVHFLPFGRHRIQKKRSNNERKFTNLMREYAKETTVHGLKYIFLEKSSVLDRLMWLLMFSASLCCTTLLCSTIAGRYLSGPTTTVVKDTHYPLFLFPFPGVSICPVDKIKRSTAFDYIYQKLNLTEGKLKNQSLDQFLAAMYLFQHPIYVRMKEYLNNCQDILPLLAPLNLTDFMLQVLPTCKDIFSECFWHGKSENCCEIFHKQRSEEGFCYSFNTLTSQHIRSCETIPYNDQRSFEETQSETHCFLRRNSASGTATGLEVYLHRVNVSQRLVNHSSIVGESGVTVQLHTSDEYPEAGMGVTVPALAGIKMTTSIKAYITESLPAVRSLPLLQRNCYFPDEIELGVAAQYSQRSCLTECRLNYFHKVCGCRPYYFNMLDNRVPICNALQLKCIAEHGADVKFFRPSTQASTHNAFSTVEPHSSMDCSQCLPTCIESYYDNDDNLATDTQWNAQASYGYLDMYYKSGGAVYYERNVTFGWLDLLVSIGGTAGLFLGISILSVVELFYWVVKLTYFVLREKIFNITSNSKLPKGVFYPSDFY